MVLVDLTVDDDAQQLSCIPTQQRRFVLHWGTRGPVMVYVSLDLERHGRFDQLPGSYNPYLLGSRHHLQYM